MFKQPKGLIAAALANMGERFGFYVMMAILSLFITTKFGLEETPATVIYTIFYALTYVLALVGGIIADRTRRYKGTILAGLLCMTVGYAIIAMPTETPVASLPVALTVTCFGLFCIAFGNGLFKGNLQAVVGQMYDNKEYSAQRDTGFRIFYMFINIGALFAPALAVGVRNWWLRSNGVEYDASLPSLCYDQIAGTLQGANLDKFTSLATEVSGGVVPTDLTAFANSYLDIFNTGFHYAFATAVIAMLVSVVIFIVNKKKFPDPANKAAAAEGGEVEMSAKEIRTRIYALLSVFAVVIFFWFSFHQNGTTLTFFARDYTDLSAIAIDLGFTEIKGAEIFASINPIFVVLLTPVIVAIFGWLRSRGKEPSTPMSIAIGMGIAACGFLVMMIGSNGLPLFSEISSNPLPNAERVTPMLLVGTYFILTIAELFISPLGLSFVSKVAPPHLQGVMQGAWLGATAVGNQLVLIGTILYVNFSTSVTWGIFVGACLISMFTMLAMVKWLERVTK